MKNTLKAIMSASLALALAACSQTPASSAGSGKYTPGTYTGTGAGFGGDVTVEITVDANSITNVTVTGDSETPTVGGAALEELAEQIKTAQSAEIDGVTGATLTSNGAKAAAAAAIAAAMGEETATGEKAVVADGTYTAKAPGFGVMKNTELEVTFKDNAITEIKTLCAGSATQFDEDEYSPIYATVEELMFPRIIESQSLATDAISGATVSSNTVKTIISKIIDENGGDSSQWYAPIEKSTEVIKLEGYDTIVVGLGASGMASYISAAQNGATVFGLETAGKLGGNGTNTAGPMAVNPPSKVAENGGAKFVEEEELLKAWMEYTDNDAKEEMVDLFIKESGSTIDWLAEDFGFVFPMPMLAFYDYHGWPLWTFYMDKDNAYISAMEKAKAMNEKNDYVLEVTADELIVEDGIVKGVKATKYDGTTYEIYGDSVVLATGGYIGNAEMTKKYTGDVWHTKGMTQCDGFAIKEALKLGGALYNEDVGVEDHIAALDNMIRSEEVSADDKAILTSLVMELSYQMIKSNGEPFDDPNYNGLGIAFNAWEAGANYYVLINEDEIESIKTNGLPAFNVPMFFGQGGEYTEGTPVENLDDILAIGEEWGDVIIADNLADLSSKLGVKVNLSDVHGKDGKVVAIKGAAYVYSTCGGLDVDTNLNLLKEDGTPVENVYIVGNDSLGTLNESNKAYVTYGGAAQGWALTSGRLVGKTVSEKYAD